MGRSLTNDAELIAATEKLVSALATLDQKGLYLTAIRVQHAIDTLLTEAEGAVAKNSDDLVEQLDVNADPLSLIL